MPRRTQGGEEGATEGESAIVLGDAFQQVAQGLARLQEALELQGQEAMRRQEEAELRHQEAMRRQKQEAERRLQEAMRRQEQETERRLQATMLRQEQEAERRHQEAMRRQEQVTERRIQEAVRLQEQRAAAALHDVVGQMETKLQENDDVIRVLEQRLEETQQRVAKVEGSAEGVEGPADKGALRRMENRMQEVTNVVQTFFPRVDDLLRHLEESPSPEPATSSPSSPLSGGKISLKRGSGQQEPSHLATPCASTSSCADTIDITSCSSTSSFSGDSIRRTTATRRQEEAVAGQGAASEGEQVHKKRVKFRIQEPANGIMNVPRLLEDLCSAVEERRLHEVRRVLDSGTDINCIGRGGYTPLQLALWEQSHQAIVALLLERGADPNAVSFFGASAMHVAAAYDRRGPCVGLLVAAGGDVNARSGTGATPLHCAANVDNEAAVRALLSAGARRDLMGWDGSCKHKTPFHLARSPQIRHLLRS